MGLKSAIDSSTLMKFFSRMLSSAGSSSSVMSSMSSGRPSDSASSKCCRKYLWFRFVTCSSFFDSLFRTQILPCVKKTKRCHFNPVSDGSKGGERNAPPRSKFFQFHAVFGKFRQNRMLAPPGELAPPPRRNPGSAIASVKHSNQYRDNCQVLSVTKNLVA